jgi:hypothetical protein
VNIPTDSEMLDWLISHGYAPAQWREPRANEVHLVHPNSPFIYTGPATRKTVMAAMEREHELRSNQA